MPGINSPHLHFLRTLGSSYHRKRRCQKPSHHHEARLRQTLMALLGGKFHWLHWPMDVLPSMETGELMTSQELAALLVDHDATEALASSSLDTNWTTENRQRSSPDQRGGFKIYDAKCCSSPIITDHLPTYQFLRTGNKKSQ